jgi:hypothetical protein
MKPQLLTIHGALAIALMITTRVPGQVSSCTGGPSPLASTAGALHCNTGNNSIGSSLPVGSNDNFWKVSRHGINGNYVTAVVCGAYICNAGSWSAPFSTSADWITFPHQNDSCTSVHQPGCTAPVNQAQHSCYGRLDEFYKLQFCLPDSVCGAPIASKFCLKMRFRADNCVYRIFVNSTTSWAYQSSSATPYTAYDYQNAGGTTQTLCHGWHSGLNTLIVQVKSDPDFTGFLAEIDTAAIRRVCDTTIIEEPPHGCCLGNECSQSQNPLSSDYEIPLNNHKFNFSGDGNDKVNVGYTCGNSGLGKFNSFTSKMTNSQSSSGGVNMESIAIYGRNQFGKPNLNAYGVVGDVDGDQTAESATGVFGWSHGSGAKYRIGVSAIALPSGGAPPAFSFKPFYLQGANIGLYATGQMMVPEGRGSQDWAAWFDGDINVAGSCYWNLGFQFSDKRLKQDINPLTDVSSKIARLNGYSYKFRTTEFKERGFDNKKHIGFIAQELKEVFPELVTQDAKGFYAVDYTGMIPVLLEAIKDQQKQINDLKIAVGSVSKNSAPTGISVSLSDRMALVLNQNVPNPFAESTVISYNIPESAGSAQLLFTTNDGILIRKIDITQKGSGNITVYANDLSNGSYTYSLVIDGKTVDSKKMIKQ